MYCKFVITQKKKKKLLYFVVMCHFADLANKKSAILQDIMEFDVVKYFGANIAFFKQQTIQCLYILYIVE
jgi:hypothetical protein